MKKGIYLTIITLITIVCMIFGSITHIFGFVSAFPYSMFYSGDSSSETKKTSSENLQGFDHIIADVYVSDIIIKHDKDYSIAYEATKTLVPKWEVKNSTLTIRQATKHKKTWGTQNQNCKITITIPQDATLSTINLDSSVGDIRLDSIIADSLTTDTSVGDTEIKNCNIASIETDGDVGDIDITNCSFTDLDSDNSVGNINVSSAKDLSDYDIDLDTSIGDVYVNDRSCKREFSQDGDSDGSVTLDNSTGDISLSY